MGLKNIKTSCSGLDWDAMTNLLYKLKRDKNYNYFLLIGCGCYFGLRANDFLNLKWSDVLNKDEIIVVESKTGKSRRITLNFNIKEIIQSAFKEYNRTLNQPTDAYLFVNRKGKKVSIQYVNRSLHKIFKTYNIKVQNGSTHTLRKTFGKRVWEMDNKSERSLIYLSEIFSHSNISTTKRYIGIVQKDIENIYLNL